MKRYVKEFVNDEMKYSSEEEKIRIKRALEVYEKGLVTPLEAIRMIIAANHYT